MPRLAENCGYIMNQYTFEVLAKWGESTDGHIAKLFPE